MQIIVGTTPVKVQAGSRLRPIIQNLGPGSIYLDTDGDVDSTSGLSLGVGAIYEFPTPGAFSDIWVVADAENTDVRVIGVG